MIEFLALKPKAKTKLKTTLTIEELSERQLGDKWETTGSHYVADFTPKIGNFKPE